MKSSMRSMVIFLFASLMLVSVGAGAADQPAPGDPAAVVNGTTITQKALAFETQRMIEQMARQGQVPNEEIMPKVREDVLNRMIEEELLFQDSQAKEIKVPDARVTEELASIKQRFPSEKEYQDALAGIDMNEADLTRKIKRGMAIEQLIKNHVIKGTDVSDAESRAFYDQNTNMFQKPEQIQARHILIKMEGDVTKEQKAEALTKIEMVRKKALDGEDFAALASEYSEGPSSAKGGDLGYFSRGQMVKPFDDAAFALEPGKVSEVVETQFGYHIIEVTDRQPASVVSYETAQAQIVERLKQEKSRREIRQYIDTLLAKADIKRS
jgi:peptidyl-prolyl cis-trans isomerase C